MKKKTRTFLNVELPNEEVRELLRKHARTEYNLALGTWVRSLVLGKYKRDRRRK